MDTGAGTCGVDVDSEHVCVGGCVEEDDTMEG